MFKIQTRFTTVSVQQHPLCFAPIKCVLINKTNEVKHTTTPTKAEEVEKSQFK